MADRLPIEPVVPEIIAHLQGGRVVLQAPPGAGKSTFLPLALLQAENFTNASTKIILLQPRRVAARSIAHYLAEQLGETVGGTVGFVIRGEQKQSTQTRLLVVTEGVFTKMVQSDPELKGVGLVIFDEFHERHLQSDLGLALALEVEALRAESSRRLRLLIMSATIPAEEIALWLGDNTHVVKAQGRHYPIELHYRAPKAQQRWQDALAGVIDEALQTAQQGVLVFLPTIGDIRRFAESYRGHVQLAVFELHGQLKLSQQQQALRPVYDKDDRKRLIFATNIAETSLTVPGIDVVVDSGREQQAYFVPQHRLTQLRQRRISQAAATQRAGRAGRLGPGHGFRLWSVAEHSMLANFSVPAVATEDLTDFLVSCRAWGVEPEQLKFLTAPNRTHITVAAEQLAQLGVSTEPRKLTSLGQRLQSWGTELRAANVLEAARNESSSRQQHAALVASLLDIQPPLPEDLSDLTLALPQHSGWQQRYRHWCKKLNVLSESIRVNDDDLVWALLWAWPERIGRRRDRQGRYSFAYGGGGELAEGSVLANHEWLLGYALQAREQQSYARIHHGIGLREGQLEHPALARESETIAVWDGPKQRLQQQEVERIGALVIKRRETPNAVTVEQRVQALLDYLSEHGRSAVNWNDACEQWQQRMLLLREYLPSARLGEWPDVADSALWSSPELWAEPYLSNIQSLAQLAAWSPLTALQAQLDYAQQQELARQCPTHWRAPSGRDALIDYSGVDAKVTLKLQEAFGEPQSPRVVYDKVVLTLDLLSPAGRLLQRTQDLASFWQQGYPQVKKEMKGRYPKHPWPDDPVNAVATVKTKRQMNN